MTIQSNVNISYSCVIAENSVVVKDYETYGIYGGNSAKLIKKTFRDYLVEFANREDN